MFFLSLYGVTVQSFNEHGSHLAGMGLATNMAVMQVGAWLWCRKHGAAGYSFMGERTGHGSCTWEKEKGCSWQGAMVKRRQDVVHVWEKEKASGHVGRKPRGLSSAKL